MIPISCGSCLNGSGYLDEGRRTTNDEGVALTIYNQNFGVVRERREVNVEEKVGTIRFSDVASQIDGTTVQFKSITDPDAAVLEQNYEYDLVSADKLLEKYIDKPIEVLTKDGSRYSGTLLSFDGNQLVIRQADEKARDCDGAAR